jgi:hypothetical protein
VERLIGLVRTVAQARVLKSPRLGYDDWGAAVYYFWVHEGGIEQQVESYDVGLMLAYDRYHAEDAFGI